MIEVTETTADVVYQWEPASYVPFKAVCMRDGDRVLGVGVLYDCGTALLASMRASPEALKNRRGMVLAYRKLLGWARERGLVTLAMASPNVPKAVAFLEHMGFSRLKDNIFELTHA